MSTYINITSNVGTTTWKTNIYRSRYIGGYPADAFDCMNECVNVDFNFCYVFVFEKGICYLGRKDLSNGSVAASFTSVTVYTLRSNSSLLALYVWSKLKILALFFTHYD
jgi:hypothetical protein